MDRAVRSNRLLRFYPNGLLIMLAAGFSLFALGCPMTTTTGGTNNGNTSGTGSTTDEIVNFKSNFGISALGSPLSVIYNVTGFATSISGYFVPVANSTADSAETGDRVIIATSLQSGGNQAFNFDPALAAERGLGFYRVGLIWNVGLFQSSVQSAGTIEIQGTPNPVFLMPTPQSLTQVAQGTNVTIQFDAQDPQGVVQWRIFYLSAGDDPTVPVDQLGTEIAVGNGNLCANCILSTLELEPGDYELGLSATDSGFSIATTVSRGTPSQIITTVNGNGPAVRVIDANMAGPPTLTFSSPGTGNINPLPAATTFMVDFVVTVFEPNATVVLNLFYDDDQDDTNGFQALPTGSTNLSSSTTSFTIPADILPTGTWFIGGTLVTTVGTSPPVTAYAVGSITVP